MTKGNVSEYDLEKFREFVEPFLEQRNESYRQASMNAGLDETAISRYFRGTQPVRDACIALADHFGINPNEMLQAAGYGPLHFFDRRLVDPNALPPDLDQLNSEIMDIEDEDVRNAMIEALRRMLKVQMEIREEAIRQALEKSEQQFTSQASQQVS